MLSRRSLITGLVSLVAAPAVVRYASLMPVRGDIMRACDDVSLPIAPPAWTMATREEILHDLAVAMQIPLRFLTGEDTRRMTPDEESAWRRSMGYER